MAQIREIKRRIKSITSTSKVTHAMELISAAKMKRAQESALSSRPYTVNLNEILGELRQKTQNVTHKLLQENKSEKQMLIMLTTDRGFVGGLNINLFREVARDQSKNIKFVVVGKKGTHFASKTGSEMLATFIADEVTNIELARTLTKLAVDAFAAGEVRNVRIIYPDFQSTVKQVPTIKQVLPIQFETTINNEPLTKNQSDDMLFEPSADSVMEQILPHYVLTQIYQTILEFRASEHSARMVSMKNATDAADDLVSDLTLTYNQARQEAITKELLDIITAQSGLN